MRLACIARRYSPIYGSAPSTSSTRSCPTALMTTGARWCSRAVERAHVRGFAAPSTPGARAWLRLEQWRAGPRQAAWSIVGRRTRQCALDDGESAPQCNTCGRCSSCPGVGGSPVVEWRSSSRMSAEHRDGCRHAGQRAAAGSAPPRLPRGHRAGAGGGVSAAGLPGRPVDRAAPGSSSTIVWASPPPAAQWLERSQCSPITAHRGSCCLRTATPLGLERPARFPVADSPLAAVFDGNVLCASHLQVDAHCVDHAEAVQVAGPQFAKPSVPLLERQPCHRRAGRGESRRGPAYGAVQVEGLGGRRVPGSAPR